MSIDNRVVKMQFDNKQFEENVSKSMTTLDKLEEKLQFKKSSKGLSSLQQGIDSIKFDKLLEGIGSINDKLSATGVVAAKFVSSIADSIVAGVKKIEQASIGQMKTGGWARAMKIENAKFAVEGLKGDWEQLYKAIDYSVTGTAYGVDAAAKAASTFMASGVDYVKVVDKKNGEQLTQMHKALRAISGVAAQTNSEFDDIAHVFTTVAGNGRLMADQLNQLSGRGMNAAAVLGEQLHMTEAAVREAVSKGKIDFVTFANAMDNAFGDHAKDANKTFTGSLSNMKAALSRFGAVFATPVIQYTNTFFIAITGQLKKMKNAISDTKNAAGELEEHLEGHFSKMWQNLINLGSALVEAIDITWFEKLADRADNAVQKLSALFEIMATYSRELGSNKGSVAKTLWNLATITEEEKEVAEMVIRGSFGNGAQRKKQLEEYIKKQELELNPDKIQAYVNVVSKYGYSFEKAKIKVGDFTEEDKKAAGAQELVRQSFKNVRDTIDSVSKTIDNIRSAISRFVDTALGSFGGIQGILYEVTDLIKTFTTSVGQLTVFLIPAESTLKGFKNITDTLAAVFFDVKDALKGVIIGVSDYAKGLIYAWEQNGILEATLTNVGDILRNLYVIIRNLGTSFTRICGAIARAFFNVFNPAKATGLLSRLSGGLAGLSENFVLSEEAADVLCDIFTDIFTVIDGVITKVTELISKIVEIVGGFRSIGDEGEDAGEVVEDIGEQVEDTGDKFSKIAETAGKVKDFFLEIGENFKKLVELLKENEGIQNLKTSLENLANTFKDSVSSGMDSFKEELAGINQEAGTSITVEDVAEAIGKFANNLSKVVDGIPGAITKIEDFFKRAYESAKGFFEKVSNSEIWKQFKGFFGSIFDFGEDVVGNIKKLFSSVGGAIMDGLNKISWGDILESGFVLGVIALVLKLAGLADAIRNVATGVSGIIQGIGTIFKNIGKAFANLSKDIDKFANAALIISVATLFLALGAVVYILAQIPTSDLNNAVSAVVIMGVIIGKIVMGFIDASIRKKMTEKLKEAETVKAGLIAYVGRIVAVGLAVWLVANAIKILIDGGLQLIEALNKYKSDELIASVIVLGGIIAALGLIVGIMILISTKLAKKLEDGSDEALAIGVLVAAISVALIAVGASILMLTVAAEKIATIGSGAGKVFDAVWAILATMLAGILFIMIFSRSLDPDALVSIGVMLLEIIVAMMIVFAGIYFLALAMTGSEMLGKLTGVGEKLTDATMLVAVVLGVLAVAILIISLGVKSVIKHMKTMEGGGKILGKILLGIVTIIAVVMICTVLLAKELAGMNENQVLGLELGMVLITTALLALTMIIDKISGLIKVLMAGYSDDFKNVAHIILSMGAMMLLICGGIALVGMAFSSANFDAGSITALAFAMVVAFAGLGIIFAAIGKFVKEGVDVGALRTACDSFLLLAGSFLIISAALAIMAIGLSVVDDETEFVGMIALAIGAIVALGFVMQKMQKLKDIEKNLKALSLAMIAFAGMMLMLSLAATMLHEVSWEDLGKLAAVALGFFIIVGVFAAIIGAFSGMQTGMEILAATFLSIAAAFIAFGAALVIGAFGLSLLSDVLPGFTSAFAAMCEELSKHSGVLMGLGVFIIIVLAIVAFTIIKTLPIIDKIVTAVVTGLQIIWETVKTIGGAIKGAVTKFAKNKEISAKLKAGITTIIIALVSSITDSGPQILQKIGDVIWMVIDWLGQMVGPLIDKIITFVLDILWGLLDAITAHVNEIEAIIKGILMTIISTLTKILFDLIGDMIAGLDALLGDLIPDSWYKDLYKKGDQILEATRFFNEELRESAKARDKAIQESASGKQWDEWMNDGALTDRANKTNAQSSLIEAETDKTEAFVKYMDAQKELGNAVDLNKEFLYMKKSTDTIYQEQEQLIKQGLAYRDAAGTFYKIRRESIDLLSADPGAISEYDYVYQAEKKTSGDNSTKGKITNLAKAKTEDAVGASGSGMLGGLKEKGKEVLGNVTNEFKEAMPDVSEMTEGFTDSMDIGNADEMQKMFAGARDDRLSKNLGIESYDTGYNIGAARTQGQSDAISDGTPVLVNMKEEQEELMGDVAADAYTDSYSSSLVSESSKAEVEDASHAIIKTQADTMTSDKEQQYIKDAAATGVENYNKQVRLESGKVQASAENWLRGFKIPLEQFAQNDIADPRTAAYLARTICGNMVNTINSYFAINSPSKRMAQIGGYIIQGLTNGIYDEEGNAISSMANLSDTMFNSFTSPLDYIAKVASGEYQYDPSIRPVLDTTNIRNGATGINSMFDHQNVTLNGLSGSLAADIGQLDGSNMEIIRELRSLRSDLTEVGDKIAGMQVVMDSGRLVGAIAPDMDRALGNRISSNYRGKGN